MKKTGFRIQDSGFRLALLAVLAIALGFAFMPPQGGTSISERLAHPPNTVEVIARHCQKYFTRGVEGLSEIEMKTAQDACAADPSTIFAVRHTTNLRTDAGGDAQSSQMGNTSTQAAACNYMALTNTAITPGAGDTTLSGEIVANGLSRAQATYTNLSHTSFKLTKTFTDATAPQAAQGEAIFNASSTGTMCFEDTFTQVSLQVGDTVAFTHTINY